jgi:hypothetical protein
MIQAAVQLPIDNVTWLPHRFIIESCGQFLAVVSEEHHLIGDPAMVDVCVRGDSRTHQRI